MSETGTRSLGLLLLWVSVVERQAGIVLPLLVPTLGHTLLIEVDLRIEGQEGDLLGLLALAPGTERGLEVRAKEEEHRAQVCVTSTPRRANVPTGTSASIGMLKLPVL